MELIHLFITATLALFGFTTYVSNTIGLENLPSLSDSYYQLKEKAEWKKVPISSRPANRGSVSYE